MIGVMRIEDKILPFSSSCYCSSSHCTALLLVTKISTSDDALVVFLTGCIHLHFLFYFVFSTYMFVFYLFYSTENNSLVHITAKTSLVKH